MAENRDYLIQLDAATGDGDLGLTMTKGFSKVDETLRNGIESDVGKLFVHAGMIMTQTVPSTMGTLIATGLIRGGKVLTGKTEINLAEFTVMLRAFEDGVASRGKSKPGERTLLDSIHPAVLVLEKAGAISLGEGLRKALAAAETGVEETKTMEPVHGRSVYHKGSALGMPDQGALVGMLMIKCFNDYVA
jgi:dihydroxyacetone kinase-like protein